jgi:putative ABC transport system permease protein
MATLGRSGPQLRSLLWKSSVEDEVDAELEFHVEMRTRELIAQGMDATAARAAAEARFGDIRDVNAACRSIGNQREREMRRTEYMSELLHDLRFACRQLIKAPTFTLVAVLTLALGVGATTAIFSAVEAVVLRPFPYPTADRLAFLFSAWRGQDGAVSAGDFTDWRKRSTSFAAMAAVGFTGVTVAQGDSPDRITGAQVSGDMFRVFGVQPQLGRVFTAEENAPGHDGVVILSDGLWRRNYAADRSVIGRSIVLNQRPYTVVGVMPRDFEPTDSHEELWLPIAFTPDRIAQHDEHYLTVVARLKPGVTLLAASRELDAISTQLQAEFPRTNKERGSVVRPLADTIIGDYRPRLFVLLGAVSCVLLIACGNVANLLLARGAARSRELAIRTAIGAGRGRIVRQLLTESLVLSLVATLAGLAMAWAGIHLLVGAAPPSIPRLASTHIDGWVLLFSLGLAVASSVVFGLVPAVRSARGDLQSTLREGGRTSLSSTRDVVRGVLVMAEVGIALTLLVGAGLLIRSALYLNRVNPGFDMHGVLTASVALRPTAYKEGAEESRQSFARMVTELETRPGIAAAAVTSQAPMGPGGNSNGIVKEGDAMDITHAVDARLRMVSPGYLSVMRIPLVAGRDLDDRDIHGGLLVTVVSASLAKRLWPTESAIGKRVVCCEGAPDDPRYKTIVGVAADVRSRGPAVDVGPEFYLPIAQAPDESWSWTNRTMTIVARAQRGDAASLTPAMRAAVRSVDPTIPVYNIATMQSRLGDSMAESRFHLMLLVTLGVVGLLLAAAGIYSVIAYFVTLRTHEIGVRMALGATPGDIVRLMTWQGMQPVVAGAVLGAMMAAWAARLLRGSLFGVGVNDPTTFLAVTGVLMLVALLATLIPARRATAVDPTTALHG